MKKIAFIIFLVGIYFFQIQTKSNSIIIKLTSAHAAVDYGNGTTWCDLACQNQLQADWDALRTLYNEEFGAGSFDQTGFDMSLINIENIRAQLVAKCASKVDSSVPTCVSELNTAISNMAGSCALVVSGLALGGPLSWALGAVLTAACTYETTLTLAEAPNICSAAAASAKSECMKIGT